jgi:hypothetical protein
MQDDIDRERLAVYTCISAEDISKFVWSLSQLVLVLLSSLYRFDSSVVLLLLSCLWFLQKVEIQKF